MATSATAKTREDWISVADTAYVNIANLTKDLAAAAAKVAAASAEFNRLSAITQRLQAGLPGTQSEYDAARTATQSAARTLSIAQSTELATQNELSAAKREYEFANEQITKSPEGVTTQPQPPATASQTVSDDAPQGPNAPPAQQVNANGRVVTPPSTTPPTNAEAPDTTESGTGTDTGVDAPVRTLEQTQATTEGNNLLGGTPVAAPPAGSVLGGLEPGEFSQRVAPTSPGVGANDNNIPPNTGTKQTDLNTEQNGITVKPQPNVLDKYSSYTYNAAVYLCSQAQYQRLLAGTDKKIDGYQLLFQSGGAPVSNGVIRDNQTFTQTDPRDPATATSSWQSYTQAGRNPFFDADFYIDNITLTTLAVGKATGSAHTASELKFTVVEPMGITLLNRLYKAVQNFSPLGDGSNKVNYTSAVYLMVIRFYGYDKDGNMVMPIRGGLQTPGDTSDPKAVVEKFIPFRINSINWGVGSKLVSYEWSCTPVGQDLAAKTGRGTIPYDIQLTNTTVGGLLKGPAKYSTAQAAAVNPGASTTATTDASGRQSGATDPRVPGNATAIPNKTLTQGLMGALNDFQQDLVNRGIYTVADEYEIEFLGNNEVSAATLEGALLKLPQQKVNMAQTASGAPATKNVNNIRPEANAVNTNSRGITITAGQQIVQVIELALRNSSYIANQSLVVMNPDGTQSSSPNIQNKPTQWFNITMSAEQKPGPLDPKRNDYAYKIKYTIVPYRPAALISKFFPTPKFKGIHKTYPFWFTGKNTAVRDYQETLNALYSLTVSGSSPKDSAARQIAETTTSSMQEIVKYSYSPASNESRAGADGKSLEPNANAAEVFYSPGDLANAKVKIIGDPAWIMQGSMFKPVTGAGFVSAAQSGFEPDGTVSFDSQDILFEMVWQKPEDYDLKTGIADPYKKTASNGQPRDPLQSRVYTCAKVISEFKGGAFEQTLEGLLYQFPKPDKSNTANPGAAVDSSDNRFARQGAAAGGTGIGIAPGAGGRLGEGTSDAGSGRGSSQFTATDPRRSDVGDGGKAAILGAQKSLPSGARELASNGGIATNIANSTKGAALNQIGQIENAPPPDPATSPQSGTVAEKTTVAAPPKLPAASAGQGTLTPEQKREVNRRALEQTNRELAEEYEEFPPGGPPNQTVIPNNQKIARER